MKINKFSRTLITFVIGLFGISNANAQITFNKEFAPQEGLVKSIEKPYRDEVCLNGSWQFKTVALPKGITLEEIKTPQLPTKLGWEDTVIKVPSPWNVNGFEPNGGGDFKSFPSYPKSWEKVKSGWLKKEVTVPVAWSGNRIVLHFEAVAGYAKVFVNGKEAGDHFDAFLPFSFDITDHAKAGETLEVLVWVAHGNLLDDQGKYGRRNYVAGSFWGSFIAGIWQDVFLQKMPNVYVADTYIKPLVDKDELEVEITVKNTTNKEAKINLNADIYRWINKTGKSIIEIPEINWSLGEKAMSFSNKKLVVAPNSIQTFIFKTKVNGALDLWSPSSPNLYGLILSINGKKQTLDKDYTRFGWRQFNIKGEQLFLNGESFQVKGDSWHFMGIPQMTRRYAYSWYQMLLDNNANGVRLHAQVFPRFYLEMADEMGICVLAETGIWSSDGGPKIDSDLYWEACRTHVKDMILRDRNYPSVFGWSVCNETLPVTHNVFKAPKELIERNVLEINNWVAIVRETDPTRTWISGDGETHDKTDLPTVIGHYGGEVSQRKWANSGTPWGIGETGMGYYGTPLQIAKINGDRAYESQLGRMEGLAGEAFGLISTQRDLNASYTSVFNLAWYGLKPLALGLNDVSRPYTLEDGIFFNKYVEGQPGYQPERLGAYASTFNPGYDPSLPLYEAWPLLDAVKAAYSDNYSSMDNRWKQVKDNTVTIGKAETKVGVVWMSNDSGKKLKERFENMAILFESLSVNKNQLILIDGANPPVFNNKIVKDLKTAVQNGSTLFFWGATENSKALIESLTNSKIEFYKREATSYLIKGEHAMLDGESNANYYFSETTKTPVSKLSIGGDWVNQSQLILEACNTDWQKWNYQGEAVKTAKVIRSEREAKASGNVLVRDAIGKGELLVSTLDMFSMGNQIIPFVHTMMGNLGATFKGKTSDVPDALNKDYVLQNALFLGSFRLTEEAKDPFSIEADYKNIKKYAKVEDLYWMNASANSDGVFDMKQMSITQKDWAFAYLSFWVYSPRSLTDLLIEPNMPQVDMHCEVKDPFGFYINGKLVKEYRQESEWSEGGATFEGLPLEKGWNHVLLKVAQTTQDWKTKFSFSSTKREFLKELKTTVER